MPSRSLADCDVNLVNRFLQVRSRYVAMFPSRSVEITCTARSVEEQQHLYEIGREYRENRWVLLPSHMPDGTLIVPPPPSIVTQLDGTHTRSKHNLTPSRAIDVAIVVAGKALWDPALYAPLGTLAQPLGLIWGGSWPHFKDLPHLELPD